MTKRGDDWNTIRRDAEITSVEFADFVGISRVYAVRMETGKVVPTAADLNALHSMIREKQAAR